MKNNFYHDINLLYKTYWKDKVPFTKEEIIYKLRDVYKIKLFPSSNALFIREDEIDYCLFLIELSSNVRNALKEEKAKLKQKTS